MVPNGMETDLSLCNARGVSWTRWCMRYGRAETRIQSSEKAGGRGGKTAKKGAAADKNRGQHADTAPPSPCFAFLPSILTRVYEENASRALALRSDDTRKPPPMESSAPLEGERMVRGGGT